MRSCFSFLALSLLGCKVVDAPENLEDLVVFGFETFDDEPAMQATVDNLLPLLDANEVELTEGFRVGELTTEQLAAAGIENASTEGIAGAMGLVPYRSDVDEVLSIIVADDKEVYFDNFEAFTPEDRSDRACFLDHSCTTFEQYIEETVNVPVLGRSDRKYTNTFRWLEHEELGPVLVIRSLSPDPIEFSTDFAKVHQQYSLAWVLPDGDGARRVEAFWIDAEVIGLDVPDSFAVDSAVSGMRRTAESVDAAIDGGE